MLCAAAVTAFVFVDHFLKQQELVPVALENGTLQYRVIDRGDDRKRGTRDDGYWDIPLPPEFTVWRVHENGERTVEDYRTLQASFDMNVVGIDATGEDHRVELRFLAFFEAEGTRPYVHRGPDTFLSDFDYIENIACRRGESLGYDNYYFRNPTETEILEMRRTYGPDVDFMPGFCLIRPDTRDRIAHYRADGSPAGWGYCQFETGRCTFDLWYPVNRYVTIDLARDNLSVLSDLDELISEILSNSMTDP